MFISLAPCHEHRLPLLSVALLSCETELLFSTKRLLQEEGSRKGRRPRQRNEVHQANFSSDQRRHTNGAHVHAVSKADRKPSALKALKGDAKRVSPVASPRRTSRKGASGVKPHASTKSTTTKGVHAYAVSKAGRKPSALKALKGTAKRVSRVASPRRTSQKDASGVKSHASTKSTKPISQGASKRMSRVSPNAARKPVLNASRGTAKRVTSQRAQAKVNHVAQKKVRAAATLPKKSTPHTAPQKKAGKK